MRAETRPTPEPDRDQRVLGPSLLSSSQEALDS